MHLSGKKVLLHRHFLLTKEEDLFLWSIVFLSRIVTKTFRRFPFEPNAAFGREEVNVGGNIIMTQDGCDVLNVMPTTMRLVREVEGERGSCVLSGSLSSLVQPWQRFPQMNERYLLSVCTIWHLSPPKLAHGSGQHERSRPGLRSDDASCADGRVLHDATLYSF